MILFLFTIVFIAQLIIAAAIIIKLIDLDLAIIELDEKLQAAEEKYIKIEEELASPDVFSNQEKFTALMKEYKNVVFFNGHSHWKYDMQELNPHLNIANYGGEYATMVHISSVSSPRSTKANLNDSIENYMRSSEGMLVTVYDDCTA